MSKAWAETLEREKKKASGKSQPNFELQKKQNREEINYFKARLRQLIAEKDTKKIEDTLKILIKLRVNLFKFELLEKKNGLKAPEVNLGIEKIVSECISLIGSCYQKNK